MPKGHSILETEVKELRERVETTERVLHHGYPRVVEEFDRRITALEKRLAEMDEAFSRGYLPRPPLVQANH